MKSRLCAAVLAAAFAGVANAQFATVSLNDAHKTLPTGAQSIVFSGTITINQTVNGWNAPVQHLYKDGTFSVSDRLDFVNFTSAFYSWLSAGGTNLAGASYAGDIFIIEADPTDEAGYYWHQSTGITAPCLFYLVTSGGPLMQSNYVDYSVTLQSVPEPASLLLLGAAVAFVSRRCKRF